MQLHEDEHVVHATRIVSVVVLLLLESKSSVTAAPADRSAA